MHVRAMGVISRYDSLIMAVPHRTFGQYEILEEIGRGGMGIVLKARDLRLRRIAAVKVLPSDRLATGTPESVSQEAHVASALKHPNIVTIYQIGTEDGADFIAMEYVSGCPLSEIWTTG